MKVLVTGGAGFIGSNLVDRLVLDGHDVHVIDNFSGTQKFQNNNAKWYYYDVCNRDEIYNSTLWKGVDIVYHLAAEVSIPKSLKLPVHTIRTNTMGTANVLELAKRHEVKRVIYSSTSAGYGSKSPYAVSKVAGEEICKMYTEMYGLETVIFRYFNVYGNRQPKEGQYAPVIGIFSRQVQNGEPMTVVGDGSQERDFVNVEDVVTANILASNLENKKPLNKIIDVGTGTSHKIIDLAKMICGDIEHIPSRQGEIHKSVACTKTIEETLDYKPLDKLKEFVYNI